MVNSVMTNSHVEQRERLWALDELATDKFNLSTWMPSIIFSLSRNTQLTKLPRNDTILSPYAGVLGSGLSQVGVLVIGGRYGVHRIIRLPLPLNCPLPHAASNQSPAVVSFVHLSFHFVFVLFYNTASNDNHNKLKRERREGGSVILCCPSMC